MSRPTYCQQPKPCDYDERDAYCIHTECRRAAADQTKALRAENERLIRALRQIATGAFDDHDGFTYSEIFEVADAALEGGEK